MIYLSGAIRPEAAGTAGLGWLLTPNMGNRVPETGWWGADNGCFTQPKTYSDERFLGWLQDRAPQRDRCLFATAPDVVGDAAATLERSLPMLAKIRELGFPAALVAQDGLESLEIPWSSFDVLFIGGSTEWKRTSARGDFDAVFRDPAGPFARGFRLAFFRVDPLGDDTFERFARQLRDLYAQRVDDADARAARARDEGYRAGYAAGVADGRREVA